MSIDAQDNWADVGVGFNGNDGRSKHINSDNSGDLDPEEDADQQARSDDDNADHGEQQQDSSGAEESEGSKMVMMESKAGLNGRKSSKSSSGRGDASSRNGNSHHTLSGGKFSTNNLKKRSTSTMGSSATTMTAPRDMQQDEQGKAQALDRTITQIERAFGKGAIMKLDGANLPAIEGISTGSISLDLALGGRGIPRGRVAEFFGPESSGKTTLALHVVASAQKNGGVAAFIDAEHALDPSWARRLGVNIDELLVSQPDTGEQAMEICELLVRSNAVDVVVVDSVAALIPRAEIEGEMGDTHVGLQARLMSQALRKLTGAIAKSHTTVIFINQIREKIGVMFGSPETTPGGRALKFYSSIRVDIRRISSIKEGDTNVGNRVRARVVKNKVAPPFRDAEFDIMFNEGISASGDLIDLAEKNGIVNKSGAWYSYGDIRLGQGRENSKQFLKDNPELFAEVHRKVMIKNGIGEETAEAIALETAASAEATEESTTTNTTKRKRG